MAASSQKQAARVLRLLGGGPAMARPAALPRDVLLEQKDRIVSVPAEVLTALAERGDILREGDRLALAAGPRPADEERRDPFRDRHRDLLETQSTLTNASESPLGQLVRRKDKNGSPFLDAAEFSAGERLRADFTRGQLMPRLGANWVASVSSGRRGGASGAVELTDAALGARRRVEKAIEAVGPELSGVLLDVCCFLKGLETVEFERGWPVRSAKIVLKTALAALHRHYAPPPARPRAFHWGSDDYRPKISR